MIGYILLLQETDQLLIDCTNDMTTEDYGVSGRVWTDRSLAEAARDYENNMPFPHDSEPVYIFEVTLPDPRLSPNMEN